MKNSSLTSMGNYFNVFVREKKRNESSLKSGCLQRYIFLYFHNDTKKKKLMVFLLLSLSIVFFYQEKTKLRIKQCFRIMKSQLSDRSGR